MARPKKIKPNPPKVVEETVTLTETPQRKTFSEIPAEDSPEYVDYIKSIVVSNDKAPKGKSYGEMLADANKAHTERTNKMRKEFEAKQKAAEEGTVIKK